MQTGFLQFLKLLLNYHRYTGLQGAHTLNHVVSKELPSVAYASEAATVMEQFRF